MAMVTHLEEEKRKYKLEPQDYGYIYVKSDFVMRFMKGKNRDLTILQGQNLKIKEMRSYQRAFFILVNMDEWLAGIDTSPAAIGTAVTDVLKTNNMDKIKKIIKKQYDIQEAFKWWYKPEVTFSMPKSKSEIPVPHLIKNEEEINDKNRRHSPSWRSPVVIPKNRIRGEGEAKRRRPDLIIVKDKEIKWPGREIDAKDSEYNEEYDDNLKCLVEMKFPKDKLHRDQEIDYFHIATKDRFSVVHIFRDDKQYDKKFTPDFVPAFATKNLPNPIKLEKWVNEGLRPIDIIGDKIEGKLEDNFRAETIEILSEMSPWLLQDGEFSEEGDNYKWTSEDKETQITYNKKDVIEAVDYINNQLDIKNTENSIDSQSGVNSSNNSEVNEEDIQRLPTIEITALSDKSVPEQVSVTMTTEDKVLLALDFGVTVASIFVPALGLAKLAVFGYRLFRSIKAAQRVNQASKVLAPAF